MSYAMIVAEIQQRLSSVENIGTIHQYLRWTRDEVEFRTRFLDGENNRLAGWEITRINVEDIQDTNIANTVVHLFQLKGYLALSDTEESELLFQQIIDDICAQFRPQDSLASNCELNRPVQFVRIDHLQFGGVLCHYAEATIEVQEHTTS